MRPDFILTVPRFICAAMSSNLFDAFRGEMIARFHHQKHSSETFRSRRASSISADARRRMERCAPARCSWPPHSKSHPIAVILSNHATTEIAFECMKDLHIAFVLHDGEFRKDLKAGLSFRECGLIPTWKQPSPSTKPVIHCSVKFHRTHPERKVSEGSRSRRRAFPADCPHVRRIFTAACECTERVQDGCARRFPHMARFY